MTTKTESPVSPRETWQAAWGRFETRRNVPKSYTEAEELQAKLEGRTLPRTGLYEPRFRRPETAAEFFDDRIIERNRQYFGHPETPVLHAIAEAAREGAKTAVKAVAAARQLDDPTQWVVYQNLIAWKRGEEAAKAGAEPIVNAVLGEWSRLHLAETDPESIRWKRGY